MYQHLLIKVIGSERPEHFHVVTANTFLNMNIKKGRQKLLSNHTRRAIPRALFTKSKDVER